MYASTNVTISFVPLRETLTIFFENLNTYNTIKEYVEYLYSEKNIMSNFIQCDLWKQKLKNLILNNLFYLFSFTTTILKWEIHLVLIKVLTN